MHNQSRFSTNVLAHHAHLAHGNHHAWSVVKAVPTLRQTLPAMTRDYQ
eukprot:gene3141-biopygen7713